MANILTTSDFVGELETPTNSYTETKLGYYIADVQERVLLSLMGYTLKTAFEAGLIAAESKYELLRDGDTYDTDPVRYFDGIKDMLKYLTYFYYVRDMQSQLTMIGNKQANSTNSTSGASISKVKLTRMYNKGVSIYREADSYIQVKNTPTEIFEDFYYNDLGFMTFV